ncbi:hypothetical protein C1646_764454 [Rhizophagus diaphanus]|nr:hypothetical protein C1646_764454 [Rhizophagus diaphanus] [Rhizophagus sp. MUCL 43196]
MIFCNVDSQRKKTTREFQATIHKLPDSMSLATLWTDHRPHSFLSQIKGLKSFKIIQTARGERKLVGYFEKWEDMRNVLNTNLRRFFPETLPNANQKVHQADILYMPYDKVGRTQEEIRRDEVQEAREAKEGQVPKSLTIKDLSGNLETLRKLI